MLCAIVEVSSQWNAAMTEWVPTRWLLQQHPVDIGETEWTALGTRWGAAQVLGEDAWRAGYKELGLLPDTDHNLEASCMALKNISGNDREILLKWFGNERKSLALKALAILPMCKKFVEAKPIYA